MAKLFYFSVFWDCIMYAYYQKYALLNEFLNNWMKPLNKDIGFYTNPITCLPNWSRVL